MHICTVATLCFPEKTVPRNYYYCVQDDNSLCLCFKNMYRTLFVAIFTSTFIFSMYDHIGLPGCVFPYLSKYKYQQSSSPSTPSLQKSSVSSESRQSTRQAFNSMSYRILLKSCRRGSPTFYSPMFYSTIEIRVKFIWVIDDDNQYIGA